MPLLLQKGQGDQGFACPEIECDNYCPNGYKDGPDGCMLCDCVAYEIVQEDLCEVR